VRRVIAIMAVASISVGASACGSQPAAPERPALPAGQQAADDHDNAIERELAAMKRAANNRDPSAVGVAQRELERLAATDPTPAKASAAKDPFVRVFEEFGFKRAPLYVQQISTTDGSHTVYAGVDRASFCLLTADARQAAVEGAYKPIDRRLRAAGVRDLRFVVVVLTQTTATSDQALAIGEHAGVRLTSRGRRC